MHKNKIYLASGWFTPRTADILDKMESLLTANDHVDLYSPRRDGVMLPANRKHETSLRESVFLDNIHHILDSDFVVANIDSVDTYNDPGTIYEIGYAMANNIPVIGFYQGWDAGENIDKRFRGIISGFECIIDSYVELEKYVSVPRPRHTPAECEKVLFVGCGDAEVDKNIAVHMMDSGANIRWVHEDHDEIYSRIDEIFANVSYMVAVIDDRKTLVSWMIGQAYARGIPVVTYSNKDYGINVMLLISILTHIRGIEELVQFLHTVNRKGIGAIPKMDISDINSM